jgi:hypothetical protein
MKTNPETRLRCNIDGRDSELNVGLPFLKALYAGKCKSIIDRTTTTDDFAYHVDFLVHLNDGQRIAVDWKGTPRHGNEWITLEWRNVNGLAGWLLGESRWIDFQMKDFIFMARRTSLVDFFIEHVTKKLIRTSKMYDKYYDEILNETQFVKNDDWKDYKEIKYQTYTRDHFMRKWDDKPNEDVIASVRVDDILQWTDFRGHKYECYKYTYNGKRID